SIELSSVTSTTSVALSASLSRVAGIVNSWAATGSKATNAIYAIFISPLVVSFHFVQSPFDLLQFRAGDLQRQLETRLGVLTRGAIPSRPLILPGDAADHQYRREQRRGPAP